MQNLPLDPNVRVLLDQLAAANLPAFERLSAVDARAASGMLAAASPPGPEIGAVDTISIPGKSALIGARVYSPVGPAKGLIVYYHGGGWVLGDLDSADAFVRTLVSQTDCAAVSVDYRLAPEHPFPAAVEDAYDALRWCADSYSQLTGSRVPLIVAGDSAGANLASVVAILDRDAGHQRIALQLLFYPVTDCAMDTPSYSDNADGLLLTSSLMEWFWNHYVPEAQARSDPRCSPLRAADLAGLPPVFLQTAQYDPLRDEGEAYARRLAEAGVEVTLQRLPGLIHGYVGMTAMIPAAERAVSQAVLAVNRACALPHSIGGARATPVVPGGGDLAALLAVRARSIRLNVLRQASGKGEGYVGQGLQCADIFAVLFFSELNWSPQRLDDPGRDRFLLSVGHYAIALYAVLAEAGALAAEALTSYGVDGSHLTLGAEKGAVPGVEFSGGSLGHGLGVAAGLACGLKVLNKDMRVFNYMSDGELQEGSTWEAAMFAGHQRLAHLVNVVDLNRTQADGPLVLEVEPVADKFRSFGWWAQTADGNDIPALLAAFAAARTVTDRPKVIVCRTRLGQGSPSLMKRKNSHFVRVSNDEWNAIRREVEGGS